MQSSSGHHRDGVEGSPYEGHDIHSGNRRKCSSSGASEASTAMRVLHKRGNPGMGLAADLPIQSE